MILARTQELHTEICHCRTLANGEWPFPQRRPITPWDVNRLSLLLRELRITVTTPLLLAACKLTPGQFSDTVQLLERFMFRFKVIGNQHVTPFVNNIYAQSVAIRANPGAYSLHSLETALQGLQNSKIPDAQFRSLLDSLNYKEGGGNQPLKYFLLTLEHYYRWYRQGAAGKPVCQDKSRMYDFATTTLEHVYPRNAQGTNVDPDLEPLKNTLGNLTIMGPDDNVAGANDSFTQKKPIFEQSSVAMNQDIAQQPQWDAATVTGRAEALKDMALAIFRFNQPYRPAFLHIDPLSAAQKNTMRCGNGITLLQLKFINYYIKFITIQPKK
ncbi:HNH endonuclease family protein [Pontibacter sp. MBLB2868]|uniref:HNH endonuclease family protein n=1 Tax=Pontibacter sp. MBLB2868 TaxID=3451555 RepID=UPI003F74F933